MYLPRLDQEILRRAVLCLGSVALGVSLLAGGEVLVRWARPAALQTSRVHREHVYSERYGWAPRPGTRGRWSNGKSFSVNGFGHRGKALSGRRNGVRRILVSGDSIAFGVGVDDGETFAERLQTPGSPYQVANLAVSGYGTDQELLRLEHEGLSLDPEVVVLNVCLSNDYVDNVLDSYLHDPETPKPRYVVEQGELVLKDEHLRRPWPSEVALWLEERSHLFNALLLVDPSVRAEGDALEREHWVARRNRVLSDFGPVADLAMRLVVRVVRSCRERGAEVLVLLHPDRDSFGGDDRLVAPFEAGEVSAAGARIIDLRRRYWAARLGFDQIAFDDIGHLTSTGHSFVAEILRSELGSGAVR
jgi:hypothetical protein